MRNYRILFSDLDGTLIDTLSGESFPKGIWDMKLKFDVLESIKRLSPEYLFIVSNQGGIEKGLVNEDDFRIKLDYISRSVQEFIGDKSTICYHYCKSNNINNIYRKPNTGMLFQLWKSYASGYKKDDMIMIGDASRLEGQFSDSDKRTAITFGIDYMDVSEFVKKF